MKSYRQDLVETLMSAIDYNHHGCIKVLIKAGADVYRLYPSGFTPLRKAAMLCDFNSVEILLRAGANVNGDRKCSHTPLMDAVKLSHEKCLEMAKTREVIFREDNHSHDRCVDTLLLM